MWYEVPHQQTNDCVRLELIAHILLAAIQNWTHRINSISKDIKKPNSILDTRLDSASRDSGYGSHASPTKDDGSPQDHNPDTVPEKGASVSSNSGAHGRMSVGASPNVIEGSSIHDRDSIGDFATIC